MAVKSPVVNRTVQGAQSVATVAWNLATGDTAVEVDLTDYADRSVQVDGDFGAGTVTVEGSNDGVSWYALRDPQGSSLAFTTAGLKQIMECTLFTRVSLTGSTAANVDVTMCLRKASPKSWS